MVARLREVVPLGLVLLLAAAVFLPGIDWGLPSHDVDRFLFGNRPVWSGAKIYSLAGGWNADAAIGADVARHPLAHGSHPKLVNGDDVDRARIVTRYRLYSDQPDEMITFRALSGIDVRHGKLDPKLYQYGGEWIYGVGGLLMIAKALGLITIRHDVAFYLDHPEAFGRFYVVARVYAAIGGLLLVSAVYGATRRFATRSPWLAAAAAAAVALMPVVINSAHEAKPHLPGAALVVLAVWAGCEYARSGRREMLLIAGALCGAAMGMVLWAAPVFVVLPTAVMLRENPAAARRRGALQNIGAAIAVGVGVYAITNPYVLIHLLHNPAVLRSNLQNTSAMYGVHSAEGAMENAAMLIVAGMSPVLAGAGVLGTMALGIRLLRKRSGGFAAAWRGGGAGTLLAIVAVIMAIPYVALAAGKPGEYGRFALVPDVALALAAVMAIEAFGGRGKLVLSVLLLLFTGVFGANYTGTFVRDAGPDSSRLLAAEHLRGLPGDRMAIAAEPAPYCLPPVDLFRWKLLLVRPWDQPEADRIADISCRAVDYDPRAGAWIFATPLSWAAKPLLIAKR
ncbi:MAG TPA: hypothetical protein VHY37_03320 [Tepidisphaeraceae bacterium]|jgi:hypothetical protein|nr:hypothetical protein [Tepidisphaeraceae bacterium]